MAWLVLINHQTQAGVKVLKLAAAALSQRACHKSGAQIGVPHPSLASVGEPLFGGELLFGDLAGSAVPVRVLHLSP
jgi:hypothetical protein